MLPGARHTLHLVGGGPGTVLALRRHFKAALAMLPGRAPLVAYVGTASNDHRGFYAMIRGAFAGTAARMKLAKLASKTARASEAKALLHDCDMVFVSGGDVDLGMKVLEDRGAADTLRALAR